MWNTDAKRMKCYEIFDGFRILSDPISAGESVQRNQAANAILNVMRKSCGGKVEAYDFRHGFLDNEVVDLIWQLAEKYF